VGLIGVLGVIFIVLKLVGVIDWSWWLVLLPEFVAIGFYLVLFALIGIANIAETGTRRRK